MQASMQRNPLHESLVHNNMFRKFPLGIATAALTMGVAQAAEAPTVDAAPALTVNHCAHVIDTVAGTMLGVTSIVIDGQRIKELMPGNVSRDGAKVIDMPTNATCLPGLIDSHTHLTVQFGKNTYSDQFRLNPSDYAIRSTVYKQNGQAIAAALQSSLGM